MINGTGEASAIARESSLAFLESLFHAFAIRNTNGH